MTTKPKPRKPAGKRVTPKNAATVAPAAGGLSLNQQDTLNTTRRLVWSLDLAVNGTELGDYDQGALHALIRLIEDRLTVLAGEKPVWEAA
jgi:hypothetical protein